MSNKLSFFHAPHSRSFGVLALLEELGAEYDLHVLNLKTGEQRQAAYLAVNPMGKVPALLHGDMLVTEQVAIYQYLADLYPQAGLAPALGTLDAPTQRGPYLRWLAFYGSCFEPAVVDRSLQKQNPDQQLAAASTSPYGDFDTMLKVLTDQLERGPYLLGDTFSAADVLWATALTWITMFGLVQATPTIQAYIDRINARPAMQRAQAQDAERAARQG